jgi:hypothetical protein
VVSSPFMRAELSGPDHLLKAYFLILLQWQLNFNKSFANILVIEHPPLGFCFVLFFSAGDGTQGFTHARQAFYH